MTRLVFITQQVDPESPVLGATVAKIRALAGLVDEVVVIADGAVEGALPANCRVRTFRAPSRAGRGARFEAALARELGRRARPAALVAHMCPIYALLAAPLARPLGVRVLLWYTHWRASRLLAAAERVASAVITVDRRSFPLASRKVVPIGHGIDLSGYPCVDRPARDALALLMLGRTSPAKGIATVIRAVASVPDVVLAQYGPSLTDEERRHRVELERLVAELGVGDRVAIGDGVAAGEVPGLLAAADCLVNNMRSGATDKVVFEAAATCLPVLASNPALDTLLPPHLLFPRDDAAALAARIGEIARADRAAIGRELRARVERAHSVESWAERVLAVAAA
ncbi:Glycosyltransferase [Gaiella occulta]|uniref:Glycosyltransferase n=1 Tax=Gaiella occulta TaxID=1002870 RepID=A0A7M2YXT5_9ACTN|nr:glycosyltransferase family 4 protein [Gaiella occulta]RDI74287.1 Glycosyltransferase [Gaiella occulta]